MEGANQYEWLGNRKTEPTSKFLPTNRRTDRQTATQIDGGTYFKILCSQTDEQIDKQPHRRIDRETIIQAERDIRTNRHKDIKTDRHKDR